MTERKVSWFVATALDEIACMVCLSFFLLFFFLIAFNPVHQSGGGGGTSGSANQHLFHKFL